MSQQGPIIVVSADSRPSFANALDDAKLFPVLDSNWADAAKAVAQLSPAAVLVACSEAMGDELQGLARRVAAKKPYLPLIAIDPTTSLPDNAIPYAQAGRKSDRLIARLRSALRVRTLHATVMRRLDADPAAGATFENADPDSHATVLLIGRGAAYPSLSVSLGERMGVIRQHAFEANLGRILKSIDAGGLLDPRTGLLAPAAFDRDFATAVYQTLSRGGGLSVARFAFDPDHPRAQVDGGRILSRLMRQMDFGAPQPDGSVIVVFAETDLRTAHMIARRLSSVIRHTTHGKRDPRSEPAVTVASLSPSDTAKSLLARLSDEAHRAAS